MTSQHTRIALLALVLATLLAGSGQAALAPVYSDTFNRANSNDLGTNDNGLGGSIAAAWVSKESLATNHRILGNKFQLTGSGDDSYINHNFTAAELGTKFSVTFDLGLATGNDWVGLLLGMKDETFVMPPVTTMTSAAVPLGFVFRADNLLVTWDNGNNGGGQAALATSGKRIKIEVDSLNGYDIGDTAKVRLYTSTDNGANWSQFTNLRNQGLSEYTFDWTSGEMYFAIESMNAGIKTVDNLVISGEPAAVPEAASLALWAGLFGSVLGLGAWRRKANHG